MELDLTADYIDVRDIIARVEELRNERDQLIESETVNDADANGDEATRAEYVAISWKNADPDLAEDLDGLEAILEDLAGRGGDEEWEGAWYPVTLIRDSYFTEAMQELCEDIGVVSINAPGYLVIDWGATADNLRADYTSVEIGNHVYWFR